MYSDDEFHIWLCLLWNPFCVNPYIFNDPVIQSCKMIFFRQRNQQIRRWNKHWTSGKGKGKILACFYAPPYPCSQIVWLGSYCLRPVWLHMSTNCKLFYNFCSLQVRARKVQLIRVLDYQSEVCGFDPLLGW